MVTPHYDLSDKLTFGVPASCSFFTEVTSDEELSHALDWARENSQPTLLLGGGSNMLFHKDFEGLVIQISHKGIEIINDDGRFIEVVVGAGENWHEFVIHTIDQGWGGIENLSLIPGCVGASPMQNIGAYGVEIIDVLNYVEAINLATRELKRFTVEECELGYRESVFKGREKGKWAIVRVSYKLDRQSELKMSYGAIEEELKDIPHEDRTHKNVSDAVIRIRQSKLPDPEVLGNAGSFFKNPVVSHDVFVKISVEGMPSYPQSDGRVKLAAGWLIDQTGWKGHDRGSHGVHDKQALVLVNKGGATGSEIWSLAEEIIASVKERFGIVLEPEVNQIR
ncbi:MAG: UDP-N-acetylenolpyruvoylglucosamine reductase [Euryarchaeota archaeon]|nr:UDP-N-acetylenolpyruvoylglucosamine reductase [Euryarchaeota archaeon]